MGSLTRDERAVATRAGAWVGTAVVGGVAASLALVAIAAGWRGSDLPAQLFRVELFRRDGFVLWDSQWFSGHSTLNYSVLSPALGAITGPLVLGALSGTVSALLFDRLVRREFGVAARAGSLWFAVSMVTNLVVGRVTFSLGVMFALAALLSMQHERGRVAVVCALLCGFACPDAGLFLAIATVALGLCRREGRPAAWLTSASALAPALIIAAAFPSPGAEPYEWWALGRDLTVCAVVLALVPRRLRAIRCTAGVYALVLVVAKVVSSPLGGIVSRFDQYAAGPLLACVLWEHRRALLLALAVPLLFWQWFPAFDTIAYAGSDPSTHRAYYQPLLSYLDRHSPGLGRVEIPSTYRHWETAFVAPQVALARGWERDLDIAYNQPFYDGSLTPATYEQWLSQAGVKYIALPDAQLDDSSKIEAGILEHGEPYLRRVWHNAHWKVWVFTGYHGLTDGPARLESLSTDTFTLRVTAPGTVTVHVHDSPHWAVQGAGCTVATADGWTEIRDLRPGTVRVVQALRGTRCDVDS